MKVYWVEARPNDDSYKKEKAARPGLVFFDKHTQPSNDDCVSHFLTDETMYGKR